MRGMRAVQPSRPSRFLRRLRRDQQGLALIEFALSLPIFMGIGMYGTEVANLALVNMHMSQAALNLADNASRLGQIESNAASVTIRESDVERVFTGTRLQAQGLDLFGKGRVILSSLERNAEGGQWIHWQRCKGMENYPSSYGEEGTGASGTDFVGMGPAGEEITATAGTGVMFVEIVYNYQGLFGDLFVKDSVLRHRAAYNIRDDRNLSTGLADDIADSSSECDEFTAV